MATSNQTAPQGNFLHSSTVNVAGSAELQSLESAAMDQHQPVRIGKCPPPKTRRPRTPIELTEEDLRTLSPDEIRKKKNRVSAQRDRERKKQHTQDLEDMVCELWKRVQYLERVIQELRPDEPMDNLYGRYQPYEVSKAMEPLSEAASAFGGGLDMVDMVDMSELAWLLDSVPFDACNNDQLN